MKLFHFLSFPQFKHQKQLTAISQILFCSQFCFQRSIYYLIFSGFGIGNGATGEISKIGMEEAGEIILRWDSTALKGAKDKMILTCEEKYYFLGFQQIKSNSLSPT